MTRPAGGKRMPFARNDVFGYDPTNPRGVLQNCLQGIMTIVSEREDAGVMIRREVLRASIRFVCG